MKFFLILYCEKIFLDEIVYKNDKIWGLILYSKRFINKSRNKLLDKESIMFYTYINVY